MSLTGATTFIDGNGTAVAAFAGGFNRAAGDTYYVKGGLRERWHPLGHTVLYGEYAKYNDSVPDFFTNIGLQSSTTLWGLGVVQEIDAAAMSIWLKYRHVDANLEGVGCDTGTAAFLTGGGCSLDNFQYVGVGGLINF